MYLNKAIIIGNLTRDPELKSLPSGIQVASFGIATNRVYKDKNGQRQEQTEFHNIVVFGRQAETTAQYLRKGSSALIEGRMQTRSWDGPDGTKRYRTEVVADRIQFGPKKEGSSSTTQTPSSNQGDNQDNAPEGDTIDYPEESISADDIPF